MITCVTVKNEITNILNTKFMQHVTQVFRASELTPTFNINSFVSKSLSEVLLGENETGLIWVESNALHTHLGGVPTDSAMKETTFVVSLIILKKGNELDQLALAQEALQRCIIKETISLQADYMLNIGDTEELDLGQKSSRDKFMSTGIKLITKRGL